MDFRPKKSCPVSENRQGEDFFITYRPHIQTCITIYIVCFKQKKTHTQKKKQKKLKQTGQQKQKKKQKKLKQIGQQKKPKKKRRKKMLFVVNNICGKSNGIR